MRPQSKGVALAKCVAFALFFLALQQFFTSLVLAWRVMRQGMPDQAGLEAALAEATGYLYAHLYTVMILSALAFFFLLFLFYTLRRESFPRRVGMKKTSGLALLSGGTLGFASFMAAVTLTAVAQNLFRVYQQSADSYAEYEASVAAAAASVVPEILYVCLLGPLVEEVLCRGLILGTLQKSFSPGWAVALCGLAFSLIHGNLYQMVFTLPLGLLLAYLAARFESLWPSVLLHVCFNSANYLPRLGLYLGFGVDDPVTDAIALGFEIFFLLCIPLGTFFYYLACRKSHRGFSLSRAREDLRRAAEAPWQSTVFEEVDAAVQPEFIVVGLGNPGEKYAATRHNAGFMALDYFALREKISLDRLRFSSLCGEGVFQGRRTLFLKPQTFMNLSGNAVGEAARYYRIPPRNVLVIYDDISFEPGQIRVRPSGSAGGHNGMKSIIAALGTEDFPRIRIGVGAVPPDWDLMRWVLSALKDQDLDRVIGSMESVYGAAKHIAQGQCDRAMNEYNGK